MGLISSQAMSHEALHFLGKKVCQEIPDMCYYVDSEADYGWGGILFVYKCPCGEESRMALHQPWLNEMIADSFPTLIKHIKHLFRKHVEGEGNVPNF